MEVEYRSIRNINYFQRTRTLNDDGSISPLVELIDIRESINRHITDIDEFLSAAHRACERAAKDKMLYVKDLENLDNAIAKLQ